MIDAPSILEIAGLGVEFDGGARPLLDDINLTVPARSVLAVVGETGAGKSILVRAILGLLPAGSRVVGSIRFKGEDITHATASRLRSLRGLDIAPIFTNPRSRLDPLQPIGTQIIDVIRAHGPGGLLGGVIMLVQNPAGGEVYREARRIRGADLPGGGGIRLRP